ncbi:MAG: hypothetical protein O4804_12395 [Trichodesmium sp. St11_bin5]|nr:hypothetical protein [Trichodesmium sp. St11_bin5]
MLYHQFLYPDFQPNIRHQPGGIDIRQSDITRIEESGLYAVFTSIFTIQK